MTSDSIDPTTIHTGFGLATALRRLRISKGSPALRAVAHRAAVRLNHNYSHTSIATAENGKHFPTLKLVEAFLLGCGLDRDELEPWRAAWVRASENLQAHHLAGWPLKEVMNAQRREIEALQDQVDAQQRQIKALSDQLALQRTDRDSNPGHERD